MVMPHTHLLHQDDRVDDYVHARLSQRKQVVMESHLRRCSRCRDLVVRRRRRLRQASALPDDVISSMAQAGVDTAPNDLVTRPRRVASTSVPVLGSLLTLIAFVAVLVAAWQAGGEEHEPAAAPAEEFTAAGVQLSQKQVTELRRTGWTCPDLSPLGLKAGTPIGFRRDGVQTVSTSYHRDGRTVVVSESRRTGGHSASPSVPADHAAQDSGADLQRTGKHTTTLAVTGVDGSEYLVRSSLDDVDTEALVQRLKDLSDDRVEDAKASSASGWERLARGWARLVEPAR